MKTEKVFVRGNNLRALPGIWREKMKFVYTYEYENLIVMMHESGYFRIKSNLMSVLFFKFIEDGMCEIDIAAGGGVDEMEFGWGAEKKENRTIVECLSDICKNNCWQLSGECVQKFTKKTFLDKVSELVAGKDSGEDRT